MTTARTRQSVKTTTTATAAAPAPPKENGPGLCAKIVSVRMCATLLCVLLLIATVIAVLLVCCTYSLNSGRELATTHVKSIAQTAKGSVEELLTKPIAFATGWKMSVRQGYHPLPSETEKNGLYTENWAPWYWDRMVSAMAGNSYMYAFLAMAFEDGNSAGCRNMPNDQFLCRAVGYRSRNPKNASDVSFSTVNVYRRSDYSIVNTRNGTTQYDHRTRPWYVNLERKPDGMEWSDVFLSVDAKPQPVIDLKATLYNSSGTFIGAVEFILELSLLSMFLGELVVSDDTVSILLDNNQNILASSYTNAPFITRRDIAINDSTSVPSNCLRSDVMNGAGESVEVCRATAQSYSYTPLRDFAAKHPTLVAQGDPNGNVLEEELDGKLHFVTVVPIETPGVDNMKWTFAVFIPENSVIGGIIHGRDIAVYISIGIVALAALLCFVVVTLLLHPLKIVAQRMYRVAALQDMDEEEDKTETDGGDSDEEDHVKAHTDIKQKIAKKDSFSNLYEIGMIQQAFALLVAELSKVKSFLPQSVLAQLYGGEVVEGTEIVEDTHTHTHTQSDSRIHSSSAPTSEATTAKLNTGAGLTQRKVTVLAVNIRHYHAIGAKLGADRIAKLHGDLVNLVNTACSDAKGVLDGFQGDRFIASFNAVTNVGSHAVAAAHAVTALQHGLSRLQQHKRHAIIGRMHLSITSGISSGVSLVGNLGSSSIKRFTILGPAVGSATVLERMCKRNRGVSTMVDGSSVPDIDNFFHLLLQDCVLLPAMQGSRRVIIATMHGEKVTTGDEWMYQLEEGASSSPFATINAITSNFFLGESNNTETLDAIHKVLAAGDTTISVTDAVEVVQLDHRTKSLASIASSSLHHRNEVLVAANNISELIKAHPDIEGQTYLNNMNDYYTTCVLPQQDEMRKRGSSKGLSEVL